MAGDCNHTRGRGELWSRRDVLLYIGAITAAAGCRRRRSQPSVWTGAAISTATAIAATPPACVVRPEQTEGPYFIDEKLNRSDIRLDPSDKSVKAGVPLRLCTLIRSTEPFTFTFDCADTEAEKITAKAETKNKADLFISSKINKGFIFK